MPFFVLIIIKKIFFKTASNLEKTYKHRIYPEPCDKKLAHYLWRLVDIS